MEEEPGNDLDGRTVVFVVAAGGVEQGEWTESWKAVGQVGGRPVLAAESPGGVQAFHHLDRGDTFTVDQVIGETKPENYDGLVLPEDFRLAPAPPNRRRTRTDHSARSIGQRNDHVDALRGDAGCR